MVASAEKPVCWWEDLLLLWAPGQTGCTLFPGLFLDELAAAWSPLIHLRDGRAAGPPGAGGVVRIEIQNWALQLLCL